jgi:hypothetical protein
MVRRRQAGKTRHTAGGGGGEAEQAKNNQKIVGTKRI